MYAADKCKVKNGSLQENARANSANHPSVPMKFRTLKRKGSTIHFKRSIVVDDLSN